MAAALRFKALAEIYGLQEWAGKLYRGLDVNASNCTKCGICEPKCPYALPIVQMLKDVDKNLRA